MTRTALPACLAALAGGCVLASPNPGTVTCGSSTDCLDGWACVSGLCMPPGGPDAGASAAASGSGGAASTAASSSGGESSAGSTAGGATSTSNSGASSSGGGTSSAGASSGTAGGGEGSSAGSSNGSAATSTGGASTAGGTTGGSSTGGSSTGGMASSSGGAASGSSGGSSSTGGLPPIQFVQDTQGSEGNCGEVDDVDSAQMGAAVQTGDVLLASVTYGSPTDISVFDDFGNTFTQLDDIYDVNFAQGLRDFFVVVGPAGTDDAFHASFSPATYCAAIYVAEYTGTDPVSPILAHDTGEDVDAGPGTDALALSITAPAAPALLWGMGYDTAVGQQPDGFLAGTGFASRGESIGDWPWDNGTYDARPEDLALDQAGPTETTWTVTTQSTFFLEAVVLGQPDAGP